MTRAANQVFHSRPTCPSFKARVGRREEPDSPSGAREGKGRGFPGIARTWRKTPAKNASRRLFIFRPGPRGVPRGKDRDRFFPFPV